MNEQENGRQGSSSADESEGADIAKAAEEIAKEASDLGEIGFEGSSEEEDEFLQKVSSSVPVNKKIKRTHHARLRKTPRRFIAAQLMQVGKPTSDEIRHEKLKISKYQNAKGSPGYDLDSPLEEVVLEDEEIERLRGFLGKYSELKAPGEYALIPFEKGVDDIVKGLTDAIGEGELKGPHIVQLLKSLAGEKDLLAALASAEFTDIQRPLAAAIQSGQRERALEWLEKGMGEGEAEGYFQKLFGENWWMFGNRYIGVFDRRDYTTDETVDIPLLRADGFAELIELKRPDTTIFVKDGIRWIVSGEVNKAVNQAGRYISEVERQRDTLQAKYKADFFKVGAKVIIGTLDPEDEDRRAKREALRSYNSHLHRIEVITYTEIVKRSRALIEVDLRIADVTKAASP